MCRASSGAAALASSTGVLNRDLKMPVAVKCLRLPRRLTEAKRAKLIQDLKDEGRTLAHLAQRHDAIVRPIEVGSVTTAAGVWIPYLVLEWLEGETLKAFLRRRDGVGVTLREAMVLLDPAANASPWPTPSGSPTATSSRRTSSWPRSAG